MVLLPPPHRFQAAVEQPLSLAHLNPNGQMESRDYCVTVVVERVGLDELDVVMDFRILEAALNSVLGPMQGHSIQGFDVDDTFDMVKKIAEDIIPYVKLPVKLAAVSLQDGAGRRMTLQP
jgi:6-pyruvoyl-tetrahydropterin synthase